MKFFDEETQKEIQTIFEEARERYEKEADNFWNSLSYEDKCNAFHAVVSRVYRGEVQERGSYRHVLYSVFGFEPDMYGRGMDCGYLELHNSIYTKEEIEEQKSKTKRWTVKDNIE